MRDVNGAVVFISGLVFGAIYLGWLVIGDEHGPDVYFALQLPMLVAVLLLSMMVVYGLANMALAPDASDWRTVVDSHGAKRRALHGQNCLDPSRDSPFANDMSPIEVSRKMHLL